MADTKKKNEKETYNAEKFDWPAESFQWDDPEVQKEWEEAHKPAASQPDTKPEAKPSKKA